MKEADILRKQAIEIVQSAPSLSEEERRLWLDRIKYQSQDILSLFIDFFKNDEQELKKASENLFAKIKAGGDKEKIAEIAKKEAKELKSLLN